MKFPKQQKIVSKKIRASARGEMCTVRHPATCNGNPETTVFAHVHTKFSGIATKSNDLHGFYCCSNCHSAYDNHALQDIDVLGALVETQMKLYEKGLIEVK